MSISDTNLHLDNNMYGQFKEKLTTVEKQFHSALDDYKKHYILYYTMPENNEYATIYSSSKDALQKISKDLFITTNDIEKKMEELNSQISSVNKQIFSEKSKKSTLQKQYNFFSGETNAAEVMADDYKNIYFVQYVSNITLFLGICIAMRLLFTTFHVIKR